MSFVLDSGSTSGTADSGKLYMPCSSQAFTAGECVMWDRTNNVVIPSTSSTTTLTLFGVAAETVTSSATEVLVIPITNDQIWIADTTNNTATTQIGERNALTSSTAVNNTGSDVAGTTAIWETLAMSGAASDKKSRGRFIRVGQVTA